MEVSKGAENQEDKERDRDWHMAKFMNGVGNPIEANESQNKGRYPSTPKTMAWLGIFPPEKPKGNQAKKRGPRRKGDKTCADQES